MNAKTVPVSLAETLLSSIRKVLDSNYGRDTNYHCYFSDFPQNFQPNSGTASWLRHDGYLYPIDQPLYYDVLYGCVILDLGSNPGRRGGKPATNRLIYGTALYTIWWRVQIT
jgi:hypothetical protein